MKHEMKLLAASALLVASSAANANVIDLFSTDQAFLVDSTTAAGGTLSDGGLSSWVDSAGGDILGGSRDLYVETFTQTVEDNIGMNTNIGVGGDSFFFSVTAGATGMGVVQWDGADHSAALDIAGLGGFDLTFGGSINSFVIDVVSADLGFNFVVGAYTDADNWTEASLFSNAGTGTATISFADFGNCGLSNPPPGGNIDLISCGGVGGDQAVDFSNLGALQVIISPGGNSGTLDMRLEAITVPEPSVLGLMGVGLLGAGFAARARRNKKAA